MATVQSVNLKVDGIEITGEFATPENSLKPSYRTVCICHGVPSGSPPDPADGGYPLLARQIRQHGFATFIFNFRGAGTSGGDFDILGWTRDLQAVLDYLVALPAVDTTRITLLGFSAGASVSVYTAAHDTRVSSVIACACPADFDMIAGTGDLTPTITYFRKIGIIRDRSFPQSIDTWRENFATVTPHSCVDLIAPRPLLLIHSREDKVVPLEHAQRLYRKAGDPKQLAILEGEEHRLRKQAPAVNLIINSLKSQP